MSDAIETLIPHRPPMRWIDALTDCTDTTATAIACFNSGHFALKINRGHKAIVFGEPF